ncbi:MAG: SDR family NAD(P)-dependent oxidoreductase [Thermoanaerobaculia bacterium]
MIPARRLEGRVAVITGGASGIGLATARRFLAEGASVSIWDLDPSHAVEELHSEGPVSGEPLDIRDGARVTVAAARVSERLGRVDILINNAGITRGYLDALRVSDEDWHAILDTNVTGALHCMQALVPGMKARGWGRILNVTSVLAASGFPGQTAYAASKSAIEGVTRVWASEFGPFGITVNAVRPGYIDTPMNAANGPGLVRHALARTPLGRLGLADDVASAFLFLASDDAAFITGAILPVDGGLVP